MNCDITSMTIINAPANTIGNRLLALFDLVTCGIKVQGCVLIEQEDGETLAKGPLGKNHKGKEIRTEFVDPDVRQAITDRATRSYAALTGREVDG